MSISDLFFFLYCGVYMEFESLRRLVCVGVVVFFIVVEEEGDYYG